MRKFVTAGLLLTAGVLAGWTAAAGGPMGITRTELGRGTVSGAYTVRGEAGTDIVVQSVSIEPGAGSGWHTHPGHEVGIVKAGTLTFYDGHDPKCSVRTVKAGEVIIRPGQVHQAKNLGSEPVEILVTYYNVPAGGAAVAPAGRPGHCPEE
jgi:quercetin dioxygenase-like cupin family protein